ncbi:hypothetical protein CHELA1G11_20853 [Hyphomicrobiales bacterium]|nr:hypothetical protein CHELA1G11_20853 [Hyphomicrobiales bacterium]CAH1692271.1 hypothetical protein CHELA1G2_21170 [Hyphomicrobiales bacterium]
MSLVMYWALKIGTINKRWPPIQDMRITSWVRATEARPCRTSLTRSASTTVGQARGRVIVESRAVDPKPGTVESRAVLKGSLPGRKTPRYRIREMIHWEKTMKIRQFVIFQTSIAICMVTASSAMALFCVGPKNRIEILTRERMVDFDLLRVKDRESGTEFNVYIGNRPSAPKCKDCKELPPQSSNSEDKWGYASTWVDREGRIRELIKRTGEDGFPYYIHIYNISLAPRINKSTSFDELVQEMRFYVC